MHSGSLDDLVRPAAFCRRYPDMITMSALRWQIFHEHSNGLAAAGAVLRQGRNVFIHKGRYFDWLISCQNNGGEPNVR